MGTPRKQRRKYARPSHPWKMVRITEEKELCVKYGLKNKKEVWKIRSQLGRIREQAKRLMAQAGLESEKQKKDLIAKLNSWGIKVGSIDDVLGLGAESILERRLETVVYRKGLTNTPKQARQFITHNHVYVGNHKVSIPSYIVLASEEDTVRLSDEIKVEKSAAEEVKEGG
ncbi:MAG: 30S ribosomal protein S4 [Candidatus Altiarchaeota archaeon]